MIKKAILLMCFAAVCVNAQTITQTLGTGANAFSIEFVTIGNPGNAGDTLGPLGVQYGFAFGAVNYTYNIGKYEVSREMIDKANLSEELEVTMYDMTRYGGNGSNRPATGISWYEAAKFVNYLNVSSGNAAAYKFDSNGIFQLWVQGEAGYNENNQSRNSLAKYFLPSSAEWHKAAFGSPSGDWYKYPTGSNSAPIPVASGTDANTAVYLQNNDAGPADVTNAGGLSLWGTMGQAGNVIEWTETGPDMERVTTAGGAWPGNGGVTDFPIDTSYIFDGLNQRDDDQNPYYGFRVAMVPEPSAFSLLAIGLGGLTMMRRRRS